MREVADQEGDDGYQDDVHYRHPGLQRSRAGLLLGARGTAFQ